MRRLILLIWGMLLALLMWSVACAPTPSTPLPSEPQQSPWAAAGIEGPAFILFYTDN